jgi:hypothetical protein
MDFLENTTPLEYILESAVHTAVGACCRLYADRRDVFEIRQAASPGKRRQGAASQRCRITGGGSWPRREARASAATWQRSRSSAGVDQPGPGIGWATAIKALIYQVAVRRLSQSCVCVARSDAPTPTPPAASAKPTADCRASRGRIAERSESDGSFPDKV